MAEQTFTVTELSTVSQDIERLKNAFKALRDTYCVIDGLIQATSLTDESVDVLIDELPAVESDDYGWYQQMCLDVNEVLQNKKVGVTFDEWFNPTA